MDDEKFYLSAMNYKCITVDVPGLPDGVAYLSSGGYRSETHAVVTANPRKFLDLWADDENTGIEPFSEWSSRQQSAVIDGLTAGEDNPCPLANVNYHLYDAREFFGFTNGRHRTRALIDFGIASVPMLVPVQEAQAFAKRVEGKIDERPWFQPRHNDIQDLVAEVDERQRRKKCLEVFLKESRVKKPTPEAELEIFELIRSSIALKDQAAEMLGENEWNALQVRARNFRSLKLG